MLFEPERYKVTNTDGTVTIYVMATNGFDALEKAKQLTESDDFKVAEKVE